MLSFISCETVLTVLPHPQSYFLTDIHIDIRREGKAGRQESLTTVEAAFFSSSLSVGDEGVTSR